MKHRLLILLLLFAMTALTAQAQSNEPRRTVTVRGHGTVDVVPDMAIVRFGIVSQALNPEEARTANAEASREAMNAVRALEVPERKIRLEQLQIQPAYRYNPDTRRREEVGFEVSRMLVVEIDTLDRLPQLIANIVQKGANRLSEVRYDVQDRDANRNEALRKALENARDKARLMAETLDSGLGNVLQISEQGIAMPAPSVVRMASDMAMMKAEAAPEPEAYAAGELEIVANVTVIFELSDQ